MARTPNYLFVEHVTFVQRLSITRQPHLSHHSLPRASVEVFGVLFDPAAVWGVFGVLFEVLGVS
jgi:hypothetical protein